jgi:hypothetical protein
MLYKRGLSSLSIPTVIPFILDLRLNRLQCIACRNEVL